MPDKSLHELLDHVTDQATFLEFAWALHRDAESAEVEAQSDPLLEAYGASRDWQNLSVSSYLAAVIAELAESEDSQSGISWPRLAKVLWLGKIME